MTCDLGGTAAGQQFGAAIKFFAAAQCLLRENWPPPANFQSSSCVDVIVCGGGTAGAALAARLADQGLRVLLLEAGSLPPVESIVPGMRGSLPHTRYDWNLTSPSDQHSGQLLQDLQRRMVSGHVLGGGGSINGMIYSRGYPEDYNHWADILKDATWSWPNVLPFFKKTENLTDPTILSTRQWQRYHGNHGEVEITGRDQLNFDTIAFRDAFAELGFNVVQDRNDPDRIGVGHLSFAIKEGKRESTVTALLNKAAKKENLYVMTDALVTKVLIKNSTAYGVRVHVNDEEMEFFAKMEVIVCAGVYNTPKLLMLSGLGHAKHLQDKGIALVKDLPVGDNLREQVTFFTYLAAKNGTCPTDEASKQFDVLKYLYNRTGSLSVPSRVGLDYALKGSATPNIPTFAIFPGCVAVNGGYYNSCISSLDIKHELCAQLAEINKKYELLTFNVVLLKPKSKGTVRLKSADPRQNPNITAGLMSNSEDVEVYLEALNVVWSLVNTTYFKSKKAFVVQLRSECDNLTGRERVRCDVRGRAMSDYHGMGTAGAGGVLDSRLRVRGVRGLRVVDGSAMPDMVRGNLNWPIVMMAEKLNQFIKEEYGL